MINLNKFLSKPELLAQNPNLDYFVEPSFQGVNRLFVSSKCRDKRLQCYDWWKNLFWLTSKKY